MAWWRAVLISPSRQTGSSLGLKTSLPHTEHEQGSDKNLESLRAEGVCVPNSGLGSEEAPDPNPAAKLRLKDGEVVREPAIIELPKITPGFVMLLLFFCLFFFLTDVVNCSFRF